MNRILGNLALMFFLILPGMAFSAADISVSVDRNPVHIDESFQLTFESNGTVDDDPDFSPLSVLFDIVRQSENSSISIINGSMTRSKKWILTVMPKSVGDVQIPAIHFGDDKSQPLLITVKKAEQAKMGSSGFFVTLSSDVKKGIEQAQIIVTVRVFSDKSLNDISIASLQFNHGDVVVETLGDETSYQTKIQGKPYLVIEQKVAIFPQKPGPLVIQPVLALGEVRVATRNFFADATSMPVRARSDSLSIDVQTRPENSGVWLPARSLTLTDEWLSDPSQFTVGEPITRVLTLKAEGLTAAQLPELGIKNIDSVKLYPDQDVLKNTVSGSGIVGIRQEKIAYIPSKAGVITLPAKEINWWNTQTGEWQKAQIPEQIITVKPSSTFVEQAPIVTQAPDVKVKPAETLTPKPPVATLDNEPDNEEKWQWIALMLAIAWLMTLFLYFKKSEPNVPKDEQADIKPVVFSLKNLKAVCQKGDVQGCKNELLNWADNRFNHECFTSLGALKAYVSTELYEHIKQLDAVLYAPEDDNSVDLPMLYQAVENEDKKPLASDKPKKKHLKSLHLAAH